MGAEDQGAGGACPLCASGQGENVWSRPDPINQCQMCILYCLLLLRELLATRLHNDPASLGIILVRRL